ncbi:MAG TPA: GNAT family N-acetyltransferase [Chloroflexia bacterium]|nr:GNAT family N-acetyltransferase [Chloroflexia bacterium]
MTDSSHSAPAPDPHGANTAQVRPATPADAATIIRLVLALAEFERLPPPDEAARARLLADAFGPRPRFEIFLATVQGQVAGYAFIFETYSTFLARPTLYLEDLFVLPEFRAQRVGYALFRYCVQEAVRRGCGRMDWAVLDWNQHAIAFYERLGAHHLADWQLYRLDQADLQQLLNP